MNREIVAGHPRVLILSISILAISLLGVVFIANSSYDIKGWYDDTFLEKIPDPEIVEGRIETELRLGVFAKFKGQGNEIKLSDLVGRAVYVDKKIVSAMEEFDSDVTLNTLLGIEEYKIFEI